MKAKKISTLLILGALSISAMLGDSILASEPAETEAAVSEEAKADVLTATPQRIRTIITTDGEIDDQCSLVRYMLYSNMYELEGLISTSSRFHYLTKEGEVFKGRESNQQ